MAKTYQNQKVIRVGSRNFDDGKAFLRLHRDAMQTAMQELKNYEYKLYTYLACNRDNYELALSQAELARWGIKKDGYYDAVDALIAKGYLVPIREGSNTYTFYEVPQKIGISENENFGKREISENEKTFSENEKVVEEDISENQKNFSENEKELSENENSFSENQKKPSEKSRRNTINTINTISTTNTTYEAFEPSSKPSAETAPEVESEIETLTPQEAYAKYGDYVMNRIPTGTPGIFFIAGNRVRLLV